MKPYEWLLLHCAPPLGYWAVRTLARTLRLRVVDEEYARPFWERRAPLIYTVWHGRILMLPPLYGRAHAVHVMASRSRDGELVTRFVGRFGFKPVRGSTTRGGAEALRRLSKLLRQGREVAVIPDGPQGPRGVVQPGVIALARITGAPIIPLTFSAHPAWRLGSWDEFLIPKPFARGVVCFARPLAVPRDADRSRQEALRKELEATLAQLTWRADELAAGA
ncbi:MAG: lysophospholipid acyltransferase family protein [Candidatus Rokubacteria bacterium]|nr:lysophospholipid acyltransferase family protein [Candidatus Rokubacteria bacterium]